MDCPKCGYVMSELDSECPRCKRAGATPPTRAAQPTPPPPPRAAAPPQPPAAPTATAGPPVVPAAAAESSPAGANVTLGVVAGLVALVLFVVAGVAAAALSGGGATAWYLSYGFLGLAAALWIGFDAAAIVRAGGHVGGWKPWVWALGGLLLWIVILPWYLIARDQNLRLRGETRSLVFLWGAAGAALVPILGLALILSSGRTSGQEARCQENLKQVAAAMLAFAQEHEGRLPHPSDAQGVAAAKPTDPKSWLPQALGTQLANPALLDCPLAPKGEPSYYFPTFLAGKYLSDLTSPKDTALLYDRKPWHKGRRVVAFCDGHVETIAWRTRETTEAAFPPEFGRIVTGSSKPVPPLTGSWIIVGEWTGGGMKQTEAFSVGPKWESSWVTGPEEEMPSGNFIVSVLDMQGSTRGTSLPVSGPAEGTTPYQRAGTYQLEIDAQQPWHLVVADKRPEPSP